MCGDLSEFRRMQSVAARMFIGLGSNLGDRRNHLQQAVAAMSAAWGEPRGLSRVYETPAWGMADGTPAFLNQVAAFVMPWGVRPEAVLDFLLDLEAAHGRERSEDAVGYMSRTLDCDLLLIEGMEAPHVSDRLVVPHPRMAERRFVLEPLAEVAADCVVPGQDGRTVEAVLARCRDKSQLIPLENSRAEWPLNDA